MRKKRSWKVLINCQMVVILVCMVVSVVWMLNNYNHEIRDTYQKENTYEASTWCSITTTRLNAIRDHLHEVMLLIYTNNAELGSDAPPMDFILRRKCITSMNDKLASGSDMTFVFVKDTAGDMLLFSAEDSNSTTDIIHAKSWIRSMAMETTTSGNRQWDVVTIEGKDYFSKTFSLGRYLVGALSDVQQYYDAGDIHVLGDSMSFLLHHDGSLKYVGGENWISEVWIDGNLITEQQIWRSEAPLSIADSELILLVRQDTLWGMASSSAIFLLIISVVAIVLFLALMLHMNRSIAKPVDALLEATENVSRGNIEYRITGETDSLEFDALYQSFNDMMEQIRNLKIEAYDQQIQKKQDELTMMRAQIRPHFYLNAITTVSNMTYQDRAGEIREYLKALAKYIRYMMNFQERMVPLYTELEQIQSYLQMQKIRFPNSVDAYVGCSSQVRDTEIPTLLVFTIVENSFKHAMDLYAPLKLLIHCESFRSENFSGCRIIVEDNGKGFPQGVLDAYGPGKGIPEAKDHIGLTNVSRTLQLVFHREDLLRLSNPPSGGARVEIFIPIQEEKNETSDL